MEQNPEDAIQLDAIKQILNTQLIGKKLVYLETCGSTNDVVKQMANQGEPEGLVVVAEAQTKGRGRLQRTWCSPPGGLWFSVLLRPPAGCDWHSLLSLLCGLAVSQGIESATGLVSLTLKWPNDVLWHGKKLCGILCESTFTGGKLDFTVVGIGINANVEMRGLPQVGTKGISLCEALGRKVDRNVLLSAVLNALDIMYLTVLKEGSAALERLLPLIKQRCSLIGQQVKVCPTENCSYVARVEDILVDGRLLVCTADGRLIPLSAGEVTLAEVYEVV